MTRKLFIKLKKGNGREDKEGEGKVGKDKIKVYSMIKIVKMRKYSRNSIKNRSSWRVILNNNSQSIN